MRRGLLAIVLAAAAGLVATPGALASTTQQAWMQDDPGVLSNPGATLQTMRNLGVDRVRLSVRWSEIAPSPNSIRPPGHFDASNPASYPARNWVAFDNVVKTAEQLGIGLDFDVLGGTPRWAEGKGEPKGAPNAVWEPNATEFGAFVKALGTRYSGTYNPASRKSDPGNSKDLPRISFWSIWNEPDYGPSLAPQGRPGDLTIPYSPLLYRELVDAGWSALHATGHGRDTFVFGELAPRGKDYWGVFSGMKPVTFVRNMYCVSAQYRPLRGTAAALRGCPTTAAGSAAFRARNPALFEAGGFSVHPYSRYFAPNVEENNDPLYTSLADIGNLTAALDRVNRVYGSSTRFPIYNTEYGYITSPPKISPDHSSKPPAYYISPTTAAVYLNQAEYISWKNPRIQSFMQYLLRDPLPRTKATDYGGYASGLETFTGQPKATYYAWRLPIYLPVTTTQVGGTLEVWGAIRPAHFAMLDNASDPEMVTIQFKPTGSTAFSTVATIPVTNANGYFDTRVAFEGSGMVRLEWTYPSDDMTLLPGTVAYSRDVQITVR